MGKTLCVLTKCLLSHCYVMPFWTWQKMVLNNDLSLSYSETTFSILGCRLVTRQIQNMLRHPNTLEYTLTTYIFVYSTCDHLEQSGKVIGEGLVSTGLPFSSFPLLPFLFMFLVWLLFLDLLNIFFLLLAYISPTNSDWWKLGTFQIFAS